MDWATAAFAYNLWDETLSHSRAALEMAQAAANVYLEIDPRFWVAEILIRRGRLSEARELAMSSLRIAETLRDPVSMSGVQMQLAELYYNLGDWEGCRASARRILESPAFLGLGQAHNASFLVELLTGNLEEA